MARVTVHTKAPQNGRAWIEVDRQALAHNAREVRRIVSPSVELMAIVKADAYGHGAVAVAKTVLDSGAASLGVATVDEGIELRAAGIRAPILLLGYVTGSDAFHSLAHWRLIPTVCSSSHARELAETLDELVAKGALPAEILPLAVHLKLDTGMTRLGAPWSRAPEFYRAVSTLRPLRVAGTYSHLATADSPDTANMLVQRDNFGHALTAMRASGCQPGCVHLSNSAATLTDPSFHYDLVRVGLALYGIWPAAHLRQEISLRPTLSVKARLTQVKDVPEGCGVSYGRAFVTDRPLRVAVAAIGYADGVPWGLSQRLTALIRGRRVRQLGKITMDQLILDVSTIPEVHSGDVVTLLGTEGAEKITVEDWADALQTIPWEVLCLFKRRLPRVGNGLDTEPVSGPEVNEAAAESETNGQAVSGDLPPVDAAGRRTSILQPV